MWPLNLLFLCGRELFHSLSLFLNDSTLQYHRMFVICPEWDSHPLQRFDWIVVCVHAAVIAIPWQTRPTPIKRWWDQNVPVSLPSLEISIHLGLRQKQTTGEGRDVPIVWYLHFPVLFTVLSTFGDASECFLGKKKKKKKRSKGCKGGSENLQSIAEMHLLRCLFSTLLLFAI